MTREQQYIEQLKELGIYEKAFDPEIHTLAMLEREHQRTHKEWRATAKDGKAPSASDPLYAVITAQRKDILAHRDALGLTPKAYKRMRGGTDSGTEGSEPIGTANAKLSKILDGIKERTHERS